MRATRRSTASSPPSLTAPTAWPASSSAIAGRPRTSTHDARRPGVAAVRVAPRAGPVRGLVRADPRQHLPRPPARAGSPADRGRRTGRGRARPTTGRRPSTTGFSSIDAFAALSPTTASPSSFATTRTCRSSAIAELVGVPAGTVKSRIHVAVERMRDALGVGRGRFPMTDAAFDRRLREWLEGRDPGPVPSDAQRERRSACRARRRSRPRRASGGRSIGSGPAGRRGLAGPAGLRAGRPAACSSPPSRRSCAPGSRPTPLTAWQDYVVGQPAPDLDFGSGGRRASPRGDPTISVDDLPAVRRRPRTSRARRRPSEPAAGRSRARQASAHTRRARRRSS